MAERTENHSASWFVIGFLAGVAATLALMIYEGGRPIRRAEAPPAPPPTVVTYVPPRIVHPRHEIEAPPDSAAPPELAPAAPALVDPQVQEDAAAAGMTSRAQPPGQDQH